ncbi:hypothetical protein Ndes2437B_g01216 [Nannochloris sp. 'desiccata']
MQKFMNNGSSTLAPRRRYFAVIKANKGFGDAGTSKNTEQIKVSKRGKVASRLSREKQLAQLQAEEREYQAAFQAKLAARQGGTSAAQQSTQSISTPTVQDDDDYSSDVTVPEQITDRMLRRMLMFSIGPVFLGFTLFPLFYYLKKVQEIDVPVWAVYIVQTIIFGGGLLGISYGIISSSFDQRREGSLLGWNEFKANLPLVLDRFRKKD